MKAAAYLVCIVADVVTCYPLREVTGWWMCMDKPPAAPGLFVPTDRPGRFVAYNNDKSCGPVGCVVASGRFERREVLRDEAGVAYATGFIAPEEFFDGMEPMDQFATSSCSFSRYFEPQ